jgi:hypothetical protein
MTEEKIKVKKQSNYQLMNILILKKVMKKYKKKF